MKVAQPYRADKECILKEFQVLRGSLIETRYDWPDKSGVTKGLVQKEDGVPKLEKDETVYISDRVRLPFYGIISAKANNTMAAARLAQDFNARGFQRVRCIPAPQVPVFEIFGSPLILYKSTRRQTPPKKVLGYMTRRLGRGSTPLNTNTTRRWATKLWNRMTVPSRRCACLSFQAPPVFWRQRSFGVNGAEVLSTSSTIAVRYISFLLLSVAQRVLQVQQAEVPFYRSV